MLPRYLSRRVLFPSATSRYSVIQRVSAYTLIELLITIAIMAMLTALLFAGVHNVRERAKIQYCQNNLREIGAALDLYDHTWRGWLPPTTGPEDDNLRPLYPFCIKEFKLFICMETANVVETAGHLENNAPGGRTSGVGTSYEYLSYYLYDRNGNLLDTPYVKTRSSVDMDGGRIWLVMDAMESGVARMPDITNNHYEMGGNVLFADSHVKWVERGQWEAAFKDGNALPQRR